MSEEDTGAPHFATGAEVEALLDKYARDRVGAHTRSAGMSTTRTKGVPKRQ